MSLLRVFAHRLFLLPPGSPQARPHPSKAAERKWLGGFVVLPIERIFLDMARKPWSFKEDRRLMELAKSSITLEEAAKQLDRSPDAIKRMALRLGLSFRPKRAKEIGSIDVRPIRRKHHS